MPLRYWLFVLLTALLMGVIGYGTYSTARLLQRWRPDRNLLLLPGELFVRLILVVACIGLGLLSGLPLSQLGWTVDEPARQILWGIGWGVLMAAFFSVTTRWVADSSGRRFYSDLIIETILPEDGREAVLVAFAMIAVVAVEELLFRSLLLGGLAPLFPPLFLILSTSLLFGAMHSPQGLWGMVGAALASMVLGMLFFQAGSLILPLMAHYVANMAQIGLAVARRSRAS